MTAKIGWREVTPGEEIWRRCEEIRLSKKEEKCIPYLCRNEQFRKAQYRHRNYKERKARHPFLVPFIDNFLSPKYEIGWENRLGSTKIDWRDG